MYALGSSLAGDHYRSVESSIHVFKWTCLGSEEWDVLGSEYILLHRVDVLCVARGVCHVVVLVTMRYTMRCTTVQRVS